MAGEDLGLLRASTGCGPVIRALGILKKCAAQANGELGQLPRATRR
jgi:fumarate hydratase class II